MHTCNRELHRLEIMFGETNEEKGKINFVKELLMKTLHGLVWMKIDTEGDCHMSISELTNMIFSWNITNENCMLIELFLTGDVNGLFQLAGRNGHDYKHCLFWNFKLTL